MWGYHIHVNHRPLCQQNSYSQCEQVHIFYSNKVFIRFWPMLISLWSLIASPAPLRYWDLMKKVWSLLLLGSNSKLSSNSYWKMLPKHTMAFFKMTLGEGRSYSGYEQEDNSKFRWHHNVVWKLQLWIWRSWWYVNISEYLTFDASNL